MYETIEWLNGWLVGNYPALLLGLVVFILIVLQWRALEKMSR